jgi:hypothetical protein
VSQGQILDILVFSIIFTFLLIYEENQRKPNYIWKEAGIFRPGLIRLNARYTHLINRTLEEIASPFDNLNLDKP